ARDVKDRRRDACEPGTAFIDSALCPGYLPRICATLRGGNRPARGCAARPWSDSSSPGSPGGRDGHATRKSVLMCTMLIPAAMSFPSSRPARAKGDDADHQEREAEGEEYEGRLQHRGDGLMAHHQILEAGHRPGGGERLRDFAHPARLEVEG